MAYVEFLRVRTRLLWFAAILVALFAVVLLSQHGGHIHVQVHGGDVNVGTLGDADNGGGPANGVNRGTNDTNVPAGTIGTIPVDALFLVAGLLTLIFGSILGPSLNHEWDTLDFAWTQPLSRVRLALTYMSVDAGAIALAFALAFCCGLSSLAAAGALPFIAVERDTLEVALVCLGSGFMWYALVQAGSAWYAGRAGFVVGFSWAAFTVLQAFGNTQAFGPVFHDVVLALNLFNPLAYVSSLSIHEGGTVADGGLLPLSLGLRVVMVWAIAAAACAAAVAGWRRLEV